MYIVRLKKVLIASPYYLPFIGGQSVQTYLMAKAFMEEGYTVEILTFVENGQMDINGFKLINKLIKHCISLSLIFLK